ncbi:hypothetical protein [Sphingomonas sp. Leaf10]|uniref:hypothetical protein n=1 Tax=Sphingomonas sp. Leaf10 TaxID=1735676 RepID=UPI0006FB84E3|nr:hypothetical protein [Sphingomonas sp. Leaf10]KQM41222.1 hypothetical protein ASE59_02775 [Sphingomonas sp. Leaf10]
MTQNVCQTENLASCLDMKEMRAHPDWTLSRRKRVMWEIPEDVPLFNMALVYKVCDMPIPTVKSWFQRKHVHLSEDDGRSPSQGLPNRLTLRSVLVLAVTSELVRLGTLPADAFKAANFWMRSGVVEGQVGALARREAGGLFPSPYLTYLTMGTDPADKGEWPCRIFAVNPQGKFAHSELYNALFHRGRVSAKIVLLNMIDARVRHMCHLAVLGDRAPPEPDWEVVAAQMLRDLPPESIDEGAA